MSKVRLEAFSDAVIAIIITIMVLEMKVPAGSDWQALRSLAPVFLTYVMSYAYLGIYWNNHHHMLHAVDRIDGGVLWANLHLLFWLSLIPFVTGWMGENHVTPLPTAVYGLVLLMAAISYSFLQAVLQRASAANSKLRVAVGRDLKGKASIGLYLAAILLAFVTPWLAVAIYVFVALMWLVPDPRIEAMFRSGK
ncbi:MAG: TMEM175 family protein [Pirellulales bacterium]